MSEYFIDYYSIVAQAQFCTRATPTPKILIIEITCYLCLFAETNLHKIRVERGEKIPVKFIHMAQSAKNCSPTRTINIVSDTVKGKR